MKWNERSVRIETGRSLETFKRFVISSQFRQNAAQFVPIFEDKRVNGNGIPEK